MRNISSDGLILLIFKLQPHMRLFSTPSFLARLSTILCRCHRGYSTLVRSTIFKRCWVKFIQLRDVHYLTRICLLELLLQSHQIITHLPLEWLSLNRTHLRTTIFLPSRASGVLLSTGLTCILSMGIRFPSIPPWFPNHRVISTGWTTTWDGCQVPILCSLLSPRYSPPLWATVLIGPSSHTLPVPSLRLPVGMCPLLTDPVPALLILVGDESASCALWSHTLISVHSPPSRLANLLMGRLQSLDKWRGRPMVVRQSRLSRSQLVLFPPRLRWLFQPLRPFPQHKYRQQQPRRQVRSHKELRWRKPWEHRAESRNIEVTSSTSSST